MKAPKRNKRMTAFDTARIKALEADLADSGKGTAPAAETGMCQNSCSVIREPELLIAAQQALSFLDTAHEEVRCIRARLFREEVCFAAPGGANERVTMEGLLRRLSIDSACLVGELRTIAARLG